MAGSLAALLRECTPGRREILHYVPYPSMFLLWWASWIPKKIRPKLAADAYLSAWDSMFRDRSVAEQTAMARLVHWFERRGLRAAEHLVVDTTENKRFLASAFGIPPDRIAAMPLALDAAPYLELSPRRRKVHEPLRVIFIGTLIPLHGVGVIADAAVRLGRDSGIELELIGDGQEAAVVESLLARDDRLPVTWQRRWASPAELAERIAAADVCLGVFGGPGKAARVLPFKLYIAMASARAIVTQNQYSLPEGVPVPPWIAVEASSAALADALRGLRDNPDAGSCAGTQLRQFYLQHLGSASLRSRWRDWLG